MGTEAIDLTGEIFGRLTVTGKAETKDGAAYWYCRCVCGKTKTVRGGHLKRGMTQSCGCLRDERMTTHGQSNTPIYNTWRAMIYRCTVPGNKNYPIYGGRGIRVCERWQSFGNFVSDMSPRPDGCSIDRIDVDGDYCPENCRWTTPVVQANNRTNAKRINVNGKMVTIKEASELTGVPHQKIRDRMRKGLPESKVLSQDRYNSRKA